MNESAKTVPAADNQAPATAPAEGKMHALSPEIRKQWSKFTDSDLEGVKNQDDLTAKVEKTYALSHADAQKQVQSWAQGRQF